MPDLFFSRPLKEIVCLHTDEGSNRPCSRHLGDIRADEDTEETVICPKCGIEWLIRQENGVVFQKQVPKGLSKNYGADNGVRVVETEGTT
jgi:hypothetical protein